MQGFDVSELVPRGFVVESATKDDGGLVIGIRVATSVCRCPMCGGVCSRVHSQYRRRLSDLPAAGVRIALILRTRRFFCDTAACERRIFAERFETVAPRARRTCRLDDVVHCLAIALGGSDLLLVQPVFLQRHHPSAEQVDPARPYIARLRVFNLLICPSVCPLLQGSNTAFRTASRSWRIVLAKRCIA